MTGAIFDCPARWEPYLPREVRRLRTAGELYRRRWDVLALTDAGCGKLDGRTVRCGLLLLPGDCRTEKLGGVRVDRAVSWGLSRRDSLTLSSLRQPVLCVQRTIQRPDGGVVEPQEIPLPRLPEGAAALLPLLGLRLLCAHSRLWL